MAIMEPDELPAPEILERRASDSQKGCNSLGHTAFPSLLFSPVRDLLSIPFLPWMQVFLARLHLEPLFLCHSEPDMPCPEQKLVVGSPTWVLEASQTMLPEVHPYFPSCACSRAGLSGVVEGTQCHAVLPLLHLSVQEPCHCLVTAC